MNIAYIGYSAVCKKVTVKNCEKGILALLLILAPALSFAIDTPKQPRGTQVNPAEIKWEWESVAGAARYDIIVNGEFKGQVSETQYFSRGLSAGEHHMSVKAISSDWQYSGNSERAYRTISGSQPSSGNSSPEQQSQPSSDTSTPQQQNSSSSGSASIGAPGDPRGTEVRPGIMKWEWEPVGGANKFEVTVNGVYAAQTSDLYLYNHDLGNGEHTMTVRAVDSDGKLSVKSNTVKQRLIGASYNSTQQQPQNDSGNGNSQASSQPTSRNISAPSDPRGTEVRPGIVKWEWERVSDATEYEVTVNGESAGKSTETNLRNSMAVGEHFMTVRAINAQGDYSGNSDTARVYVEGHAQDAAMVQPPAPQQTQQDDEQSAAAPAENDNGIIDPQSWSQPGVGKDNYKLVFSDEFNADRLNSKRWNTQLRWDGSYNGERYEYRTINGEDQFYVNIFSKDQKHLDTVVPGNNPFEFNGSRLAIRAKRNPLQKWEADKGYGPLYDMVSQQNFLSGAISTYDKFSQKYGYFEARIKIPKQVGTFPAFWLHHQKRESEGTQKTEIDIMENLGHAPHYVYTSFHYFTGVAEGVSGNPHFIKPKPEGQIFTGINYNEQYHVYAVEWNPGHIKYMIDGEVVSQVWNDNVNHEELYIIMNMAIGGNWTNYPSNAGGTGREEGNHFPNKNDMENWSNPALEVDYIRVYKRN